MATTSWTQDDLDTIERAIADGVMEVEYDSGRRVRYHSIPQMKQARELIRKALGCTKRTGTRVLARTKKGTC